MYSRAFRFVSDFLLFIQGFRKIKLFFAKASQAAFLDEHKLKANAPRKSRSAYFAGNSIETDTQLEKYFFSDKTRNCTNDKRKYLKVFSKAPKFQLPECLCNKVTPTTVYNSQLRPQIQKSIVMTLLEESIASSKYLMIRLENVPYNFLLLSQLWRNFLPSCNGSQR